MMSDKFHKFSHQVDSISLPERFTYPFHYTPHPLCVMAAEETQAYLMSKSEWKDELENGKMFGVLIVQSCGNEIGFLAAFSGNLAGSNEHDYFVPPIYDLLRPDGFFRIKEGKINEINRKINELTSSPKLALARANLEDAICRMERMLNREKALLKEQKDERDRIRQGEIDEEIRDNLIKQSQRSKALYRERVALIKTIPNEAKTKLERLELEIEMLKMERKRASAALQHELFEQFKILNNNGEIKDLCEIFKETINGVPPAGAGECAAPKLLQYAYINGLKPIAMAEFWWGNSPKGEIRTHGYYYPACKGKCEPILNHMLKGLKVDENPLLQDNHKDEELEILYDDDYIVAIKKPEGMLSVPGKSDADSVYQRLTRLYPEATGPLIVHRLDMATSGILIAAKNKEVHQNLQAQFEKRKIEKRYVAILDGEVKSEEGEINLPICPNTTDRPRQMVSYEHGKPAITKYRVIGYDSGKTRILFYPHTGRTHQLRVHAAHHQGLNAPILGDKLYGKRAERLYLHAEYITFTHPITGERVEIEAKPDF